ncbi:unnamed protein product [Dicrocoelium dendriticum]|nr:unnamed protein product [Dicrocoelium dendriticum]
MMAQVVEEDEVSNPLLIKAQYIEPHGLLIRGNLVLAFLNLSRNSITQQGLIALLNAVTFQNQRLKDTSKMNGTGLMKVFIRGNLFDEQCEPMQQLAEIMSARDPLQTSGEQNEVDGSQVDGAPES